MNFDAIVAAVILPISFILLLMNLLVAYCHYHRGKRWCVWVALAGAIGAAVAMIFCFKQLWA